MNPQPAGGRYAPPVVALALRAVAVSWRVRTFGRERLTSALRSGAVVAFWHGQLLPMVAMHRGLGLIGLASRSPDGELAAACLTRLGFDLFRGSSSRGGAGAVRAGLRFLEQGRSPAIAVDGPSGPRHVPHGGALMLAARSGRPVVYGVAVVRPVLRLRSWDHFELPLPFARVDVGYGQLPAPSADRQAIDAAREKLAWSMARLEDDLREGRLSPDVPPSTSP